MKLGEKIKRLRTEKMMTQSELSGDMITRNMLSSIENGAAEPSLKTLDYLAARLGVPVGFLLSDGADELMYRKMSSMDNIKRALSAGSYSACRNICLDILKNAGVSSDDELDLILAECGIGLAKEALFAGMFRAACDYLDEATQRASATVYCTEKIDAAVVIYYRYMRRFSKMIYADSADGTADLRPALTDGFCEYVLALEATEGEELSEAEKYVSSQPDAESAVLHQHISARLMMKNEDFEGAYECLSEILRGQLFVTKAIMYDVFCDLEICCKEIGNYKEAYEYATGKVDLLQKIISDSI